MKTTSASATFLLAASAAAFPGMPIPREELEAHLNSPRAAAPEPAPLLSGTLQTLTGTVDALTNTIEGLLGSVAEAVDPNDLRPEPGYPYKAPGPNDSRGPCPGLNLLANHGYLPRNGLVTFGEVLTATAAGFNMAADLAAVLSVFAVLTDGDIVTESWWLGTNPSDSTHADGLNRHSTVEADVSPNREDFYNGCGDNHHLSSRLFTQNVGIAAQDPTKSFTTSVMEQHYGLQAQFAKTYNPFLYEFPFPQIVSLGAYVFYSQLFANGTYGAGGVSNYESVSSIIGAKYDSKKGQFEYVPERFPENWYRRSTPWGAVETVAEGYVAFYPVDPITPGASTLGTTNFNATTLLCDVYQGVNSIVPLFVSGTAEELSEVVSWVLSKLDPYFGSTALGCPGTAISTSYPGLFPDATQTGGPLKRPAAQNSKTGNNVYNKIYFPTAPTKPQC